MSPSISRRWVSRFGPDFWVPVIILSSGGILALAVLGFLLVSGSRFFVPWKKLSNAPVSANRIMVHEPNRLVIRGGDGSYWAFVPWLESWEPTEVGTLVPQDPEVDECPPITHPTPAPNFFAVQMAQSQGCTVDSYGETYYALASDGSVWKWEYRASAYGQLALLYLACLGAPVGAVIGGVITVLLRKNNRWPFDKSDA